MALSNEVRKLIQKRYMKTHNRRETAEIFEVSVETVRRINKRYEETGNTDSQLHTRGRKAIITKEIDEKIKAEVTEHPDITAQELIQKFKLTVTDSAIYQHLHKMGFTRKKKSLYATERRRLRCAEKTRSMGE